MDVHQDNPELGLPPWNQPHPSSDELLEMPGYDFQKAMRDFGRRLNYAMSQLAPHWESRIEDSNFLIDGAASLNFLIYFRCDHGVQLIHLVNKEVVRWSITNGVIADAVQRARIACPKLVSTEHPNGYLLVHLLSNIVPNIHAILPDGCPACVDDGPSPLSHVIQHLNDRHKWTRELIADWLDALPIDLSVRIEERRPLHAKSDYKTFVGQAKNVGTISPGHVGTGFLPKG